MDDVQKRANRLLAIAKKEQGLIEKTERRRRATPAEPAPESLYCVRCLALVKPDKTCPRCDHQEQNFFMYCRKCLRVHGSLVSCTPWAPSPDSYQA